MNSNLPPAPVPAPVPRRGSIGRRMWLARPARARVCRRCYGTGGYYLCTGSGPRLIVCLHPQTPTR